MSRRRVAITGLGLLTPLGTDLKSTWSGLVEGKNGVGKITRFDTEKYPVKIAAEVKDFDTKKFFSPKDARKYSLFIQYGLAATSMALEDAGLSGRFGEDGTLKDYNPDRAGVIISAGMGGLPEIEHWHGELEAREKKATTPFFIPQVIPNMISGFASIQYNAKGPNSCIVTACASSAHGIGESARLIQNGYTDVMITGGAEAVVCKLGIAGFASMKALSSRNDAPEKASRPYDKDRDGFVLGEGAGVLVLEEWESAKKRGAKIYGEVVGYGANSDAYHMTSPAPEGVGAEKCINLALKDAGLNAEQIGYVNTHGTSTPVGDGLEAQALGRLFGNVKDKIHISSTKSMTGHLLGAAGSTEAIYCALSLKDGVIPPTRNLDEMDDLCKSLGLNFTPNTAQEKKYEYALSNSFGFGGTNASLIIRKEG